MRTRQSFQVWLALHTSPTRRHMRAITEKKTKRVKVCGCPANLGNKRNEREQKAALSCCGCHQCCENWTKRKTPQSQERRVGTQSGRVVAKNTSPIPTERTLHRSVWTTASATARQTSGITLRGEEWRCRGQTHILPPPVCARSSSTCGPFVFGVAGLFWDTLTKMTRSSGFDVNMPHV